MTEIELGVKYRDRLTGYEGWAVARTEYLAGNVTICLERADSGGKPEEVWISEQRLEAQPRNGAVGFVS
jgi:hypothetical protein